MATYQQFVERAPVGMAVLHVPDPNDTSTWNVVAANWLARRVIGSSASAFLDGPLTINLPPEKTMADLVRHALQHGRMKNLGHFADVDYAASGAAWLAKLFAIDDCCVAFCIEDQSLLRQTRDARSEADRQCALISELARAILWRADIKTLQVNYVSPHAQQILGFWTETWRTEHDFWKNHVHPEDLELMLAHCAAVRDEGQPQECEFRMISAQKAVMWFRLLVRQTMSRIGPRELLGVMTEVTKLKDAEQHNQDLSRRLIHLQDQEHRRISRELHDSVGQNLAALRMSLHVLEHQAHTLDEKGQLALSDAVSLSDAAIQETRTVSYLLHPPVLDELGLLQALEWFVDGFGKRSGINVSLHVPAIPFRLPAEMELALFRVVQECLTNVHRHAHSATADIRVQADSNSVLLEITDSGRGIPPKVQAELRQGSGKTGVGLSGIRERIAELHGSLDLDSSHAGTTVRVLVPLPSLSVDPESSEPATRPSPPLYRTANPGKPH